jgi:hypothetical protein
MELVTHLDFISVNLKLVMLCLCVGFLYIFSLTGLTIIRGQNVRRKCPSQEIQIEWYLVPLSPIIVVR